MTETRSSDNKYLQGINLVEEYEAVSVCQTNARVLGKTVKWICSVQKIRLGGLMVVKEQTWKGGRVEIYGPGSANGHQRKALLDLPVLIPGENRQQTNNSLCSPSSGSTQVTGPHKYSKRALW